MSLSDTPPKLPNMEKQIFMDSFQCRITELYEEARDNNPSVGREAFARKCGITKGQLSGYLDGNFKKFCQTLCSIASANNVSVSWLAGEVHERSNSSGILQEILEGLSSEDLAIVRKVAEGLKLKNKYDKEK